MYYALTIAKEEYIASVQQASKLSKGLEASGGVPERVIAFFKEQEKKCDCCICLESMENETNSNLYMLPCCAHLMHNKCAKQLTEGKKKVPCPLCKKEVSIYIKE